MTTSQLNWRLQGPCSQLSAAEADMLFFPDSGRSINKAKAFCAGCPVADICLEFALDHAMSGIWAGTSEKERNRIRLFRYKVRGVVAAQKVVARRNIVFT